MPFLWDKQSIDWFIEASAYGTYHNELAAIIAPHLRPVYTLCDLGCGLGGLDIALAGHVHAITAIDLDRNVTRHLRRHARLLDIRNLHVLCGDALALRGRFDVLLMSFFGKSGRCMDEYAALCERKLIRIVNAENNGSLYPPNHRHTKKDTVPVVEAELRKSGYRYLLLTPEIEFGQPLRSLEDGKRFVLHHAPDASEKEAILFLAEHAVPTGRADFPLYLPNRKKLGVFVIDMQSGNHAP